MVTHLAIDIRAVIGELLVELLGRGLDRGQLQLHDLAHLRRILSCGRGALPRIGGDAGDFLGMGLQLRAHRLRQRGHLGRDLGQLAQLLIDRELDAGDLQGGAA